MAFWGERMGTVRWILPVRTWRRSDGPRLGWDWQLALQHGPSGKPDWTQCRGGPLEWNPGSGALGGCRNAGSGIGQLHCSRDSPPVEGGDGHLVVVRDSPRMVT